MEEPITIDTVDHGEISAVHIAPIGDFYGSDIEGNPVKETLTAEDLAKLADELNASSEEVLADVDHGAARAGVNKDTKAAGWFSKFVVDPVKGLFAKLKLTKYGKDLLQSREYRWVSPTFQLDAEGKPVSMGSISFTNTPAFAGSIRPILNAESKGIENMTKEELVELIKDTVKAMKVEEETAEEAVEKTEVVDQTACDDEQTANEQPEAKTETCADEKPEETVTETQTEQKTEIEKPEETEEEKKEEKTEVIKIEALNQASSKAVAPSAPKWQSMDRNEFIAWFNAGNR